MGRRGYSTTIGKFAKLHHDRRVSEIRVLGETLLSERHMREAAQPQTAPKADGAGLLASGFSSSGGRSGIRP